MTRAVRQRWETEDGRRLVATVLKRLEAGESLVGLGLGQTASGLTDLRGLTLPEASTVGIVRAAGVTFAEQVGLIKLESVHLAAIDFSDARLDGLMLFHSTIEDCVFDGAEWNEGRLFSSRVERSSFRNSKLFRLGIGPEESPSRSVMRDVVFEKTDLRSFAPWGLFERCRFDHVRMKGVFLDGARFRDCVFRGRLQDNVFAAQPRGKPEFERNDMDGCDFSEAELIHVAFNDLAMRNVMWPRSERQTLFDHYPCVLRKTVDHLQDDARPGLPGAQGVFELYLEWMHPDRREGVVHEQELGGFAREILSVMRRFQDECHQAHDSR